VSRRINYTAMADDSRVVVDDDESRIVTEFLFDTCRPLLLFLFFYLSSIAGNDLVVFFPFYRAMIYIHGTSHGLVSVCHKSVFY